MTHSFAGPLGLLGIHQRNTRRGQTCVSALVVVAAHEGGHAGPPYHLNRTISHHPVKHLCDVLSFLFFIC
jgi:hypothetical protein